MSSIQHPYTQVGQSETFELQPLISVGASPSFKGIVVHEGDEPRSFADEDELKRYLGQYPEAENDQATRLFQYTPECPPRLLVALFEKFEFSRFSMVPKGAAGEILRTTGLGTGQCKCDKCKTGGFCGYYALEFAISFWQYHGTSIDAENRLEVTGNDTLFAIYGGGQKSIFRLAPWTLQLFRFPSRRLEHIEHAFDALICHMTVIDSKLASVPIGYIINVMEIMLQNWEDILNQSKRFLSYFSIEILSVRLETDRSIIRHLLGAAQLWKALFELIQFQVKIVSPLLALPPDNHWFDSASDHGTAVVAITEAFDLLGKYQIAIQVDLLQETDVLIQRISNLISIDEGYRSRDLNASLARLSWITFIFLPLVFATGIFGMNVDLFQDNPSWKYYIYFLIPLCAVVGLGYAAFRYGPSVLAYVRSKRVLHDTESNEALLNDSTVLSWAAATGQIDTLTYVLGGHGTVESAQGNAEGYALIPAAMNGHVEAVRILIRDPHTKINVVDAAGATALHHASRRGFAEVVELLLSHRASLEVKDQADQTPLDWAIQGGDGESTALILRQKYSLPEEEGEPLQPSLHYAAISADLAIFDLLLQGGFNPYQRNNKGRIPLFSALESRNIDFFGHALEKIADRTSTDNYGFNLLHVAVEMDYVEAVKLLVQKVIPINQRSAGSLRTPLLCINAMPTNDTLEILKVLVEHNADVNMYDSSGNTLIHLLAKSPGNCSPLINFLADKGAKLDEINNMENTPHHLAAAVGNLEAIKALSRAPEGFNMRNGIRRKPIEVAASNGFLEIVMEIQKLDGTANVTSPSQEFDLRWSLIEEAIKTDDVEKLGSILRGWGGSHEREDEAFHLAILENAPQATSYLLKVGCKIELAASRLGQFNSSVLQLAIERKCQKTVPIILEAGVSVDGTDDYGWTCLHSAAQVDDFDAASRIAPIIFNKDQRDEMGWTALDLAWHWKHQRIFDLLHSGGEYLHPYDLRRTKYYPGCPFSSPPGVTGPIEVPAISR